MRVLITGSRGKLGSALAVSLAPHHDVRTLDLPDGGSQPTPDLLGDPRDREFAASAVADSDVVIHTVPLAPAGASGNDLIDSVTRGTYNLLTTAPNLARFILITSLRPFERYPMEWWVDEDWAPRPTTDALDLASYLAEVTTREIARLGRTRAICLRMGEIVDDEDVARRIPDPRWVHIEDAVQSVRRALAFEPDPNRPQTGWWVYHIVGGGSRTRFPLARARGLGYVPTHDLSSAVELPLATAQAGEVRQFTGQPGGRARKVVIFGAGGPLGAITAELMAHDHVLRLADIRPVAEITKPQNPNAPLPRDLGAPHEWIVGDVADPEHVLAAARGTDAIVNCSVVRPHPVGAFSVNTIGALNIVRAAVELGIRRVVRTGPEQLTQAGQLSGYWWDHDISPDSPARPGDGLYVLTKLLGQEIWRIFAEEHDLEVPVLNFGGFVNPNVPPEKPSGVGAFTVSWPDAGEALQRALHAASFPRPFEVFNITADLPTAKVSIEKAKRLLGWQPRDGLQPWWRRKLE